MTDKFMINCSNCGDEYTVWNFTGTAQPPKQCNKCDSTKIIVTSSEDSEQKKKQKLTSQQTTSEGRFGIGPELSIECFDCKLEFGMMAIGLGPENILPEECPKCGGKNIKVKKEASVDQEKATTRPHGYFGKQAGLLAIQLPMLMELGEDYDLMGDVEKAQKNLGRDDVGIGEVLDPYLPKELGGLIINLGAKRMGHRVKAMSALRYYLLDVYEKATDIGKNKDSKEYKQKFGVLEKFIPMLEDYMFKTIESIDDYHLENQKTYGEFFQFLSLLSNVAASHIELTDLAQFIENTKKEEYSKVIRKLLKWTEDEKHSETRELLREYIGLLNMSV